MHLLQSLHPLLSSILTLTIPIFFHPGLKGRFDFDASINSIGFDCISLIRVLLLEKELNEKLPKIVRLQSEETLNI